MNGRIYAAALSLGCLGLLGSAWVIAHRIPRMSPRHSRPVAQATVEAARPLALPSPPRQEEPAVISCASLPAAGVSDEELESRDATGLFDELAHEANGARPRRLEYVRGLLLDRIARDPSALRALLERFEMSADVAEIGALVRIVEEHAATLDAAARLPLEVHFLETLRRGTQADRRNAALHFLLTVNEAGSLSDGTIEALRPIAECDAAGVVRAGAMWLVAAREEASARDARFLGAIRSDADATVRETAAEGIGTLGSGPLGTGTADDVVSLLATEGVAAVRRRLVASLSQRGVENPVATVRRLGELAAKETDAEVRHEYVAALVQVGGTEARPWLEAFRSDPLVGEDVRSFLEALNPGSIASFGEGHR